MNIDEQKLERTLANKRRCEKCNFECIQKSEWDSHILTDAHKTADKSKKHLQYECTQCNFVTRKKTDYAKHLTTSKHLTLVNSANSIVNDDAQSTRVNKQYTCACGNIYKFNSGFCRHKKICTFTPPTQTSLDKSELYAIFQLLFTENRELHNIFISNNNTIMEQNKTIIEQHKTMVENYIILRKQNNTLMEENNSLKEQNKTLMELNNLFIEFLMYKIQQQPQQQICNNEVI
uniref:C2H2-type domain-containing protein n=1 Tax=viral metagenome TaxID=1070528 RepID=A0A6C0KKV2_9ZZZZ